MRVREPGIKIPFLFFLFSLAFFLSCAESEALPDPMVKFKTLKETVAMLLPEAKHLSRRDIDLTKNQLQRLEKNKNWDTDTTEFVIYHAKNEAKKITRTLILFPERSRQGTIVVAVALDNSGVVTGTLLMEAQQPTVQHLMPVLRAGYMDGFVGKDKSLKLKLDKKYQSDKFSTISQTYALRIANSVKKSAQLFDVFFKRK